MNFLEMCNLIDNNNKKLLVQTNCFYLVTVKLGNFPSMGTTSEQQRIAFSKRLTQELKRVAQPIGSPTKIARTFNQHYSGQPVSAQTVRKWLLAEAVPTQPKLLALSTWLGVSAQWLRYGAGERVGTIAPLSVQQTGLLVLGKKYAELAQYAGIVSLLDKLVRLPPRDIRIVEGMVQLMYAENGGK
ncbi:MAG: hypothetical protein WDM70_05610 [Nitrosomonadales bacterium]